MKPKTENRTRWECVCVWKIILTLFFPLTVHFSTSFVFQVSFWKMNREPTVSSKTSCFSPSQLLLLPIVQVLLRDSCDENLINFNKLLWRKTSKQRNISDACCGSSSSSVGSCGASVIKNNSGSVKMHTRVKQNTKRCSQHFTVYIRRSQLASINLLAKSPVLIL